MKTDPTASAGLVSAVQTATYWLILVLTLHGCGINNRLGEIRSEIRELRSVSVEITPEEEVKP